MLVDRVHREPAAAFTGETLHDLSVSEYQFERRMFGSNPDQLRSLVEWLQQQEAEEVVGLSLDGKRWVPLRYAFFLPVKVLSRVFRGKFIAGLKRAFRDGELSFPGSIRHLADEKVFHSFLRSLFRHDWVVYAKRPFGGPEHVLHYLARYTPSGHFQSQAGQRG